MKCIGKVGNIRILLATVCVCTSKYYNRIQFLPITSKLIHILPARSNLFQTIHSFYIKIVTKLL